MHTKSHWHLLLIAFMIISVTSHLQWPNKWIILGEMSHGLLGFNTRHTFPWLTEAARVFALLQVNSWQEPGLFCSIRSAACSLLPFLIWYKIQRVLVVKPGSTYGRNELWLSDKYCYWLLKLGTGQKFWRHCCWSLQKCLYEFASVPGEYQCQT